MSKWFFLAVLMIAYSLSSLVPCIKNREGNQTSGGAEKALDIGQVVLSVVLLILSCGIIIKEFI